MLSLTLTLLLTAADAQTVVTGTRTPRHLDDAPVQTRVIPRAELNQSPTAFTDELLRAVPSVQTFRRSSSLTADPTSQGLSLRGLGPSGVSRAALLLDGIPVNDGFGAWAYWRAFPRLGLDRLEVVPGAASAQYGSGALSGVVQLFTRPIAPGFSFDADGFLGTQQTTQGAARIAGGSTTVRGALEVEAFQSEGYAVVAPAERGPLDVNAPSSHLTSNARLEANLGGSLLGFVSGGWFHESQSAGTPLSGSSVSQGHAELGFDWDAGGHWQARLFGRLEEFIQTRSRVAPLRDSEREVAHQDIPINDEGLSLNWTSTQLRGAGTHQLTAGLDGRVVGALGRDQQLGGVYLQDAWKPLGALELVAALRADGWHNGDRLSGALSPKLALHWKPHPTTSLRAAVYRAFRAPTLNELFRPFQVGTIVTAANPDLKPETVNGGDLGVESTPLRGLTVRATGFANWLEDPIVNVTLTDGNRQRQNQGVARIVGAEGGAELHVLHELTLAAAYTWVDARVVAGDPALVGKRLAQDPAHRFTASVTYANARVLTATVQVRVLGEMFEDDRNTLLIPAVVLLDASVARQLAPGLELFVAAQNLTNTVYLVGRAGIDTVGPPLQVRAGLRIRSEGW